MVNVGVPSLSSLFSLFSVSSLLHFSLLSSLCRPSPLCPHPPSSLSLSRSIFISCHWTRKPVSFILSLFRTFHRGCQPFWNSFWCPRALCHCKHLLKHRCQLSNSHSHLNRWDCLVAPCSKVRMLLASTGPLPLHSMTPEHRLQRPTQPKEPATHTHQQHTSDTDTHTLTLFTHTHVQSLRQTDRETEEGQSDRP